ncbi:MAG: S9 family peptidase [Anaerolineales bacterium]
MPDHLDLEILLKVPHVDPDLGFDISPDGSQLVFSWNQTGRWEIYCLDLKGKSSPRIITQGKGAKFAPRWSPDGNSIAYVLDLDGSENYDIFVYHPDPGTHTNLTPDTPDAILPLFDWSPDSQQIAFCSDRGGCFDTYVMPSGGGEAQQVLGIPYPDSEVVWSPDGKKLAVASEGKAQDSWIHIVPLDGGDPYPISLDGSQISAKDPCWSPDSRTLPFSSDLQGKFEIGLFEIKNRSFSWLTNGPGEKESPDWSEDGFLAYVTSHGPKTNLTLMDMKEGSISTHQVETGVIYTPKFTPAQDQIIFVFDNPRHPDDLWAFNRLTNEFRQLTHSLPPGFEQTPFTMPEEVWYPSLDGTDVPALLYRPKQTENPPPAVIYIHGGPNWLTQVTWDPLVQHMVSRGWVVLAPNYRGSTGYGRKWMNANRFDLGGVDTADVAAGADFLERAGIADAKKIALTGRSWGGYLTMTCLTQFPEKWTAGSAVVPFLNWFTSHENSREDLQHWDRENFGDPVTNNDIWHERSPFFFLDQIQSPVQLICGENDVRCPASESKQAYEKLINLGKECEYHLYRDEGHSFLKIENQIKSKGQSAEFLAKYLE